MCVLGYPHQEGPPVVSLPKASEYKTLLAPGSMSDWLGITPDKTPTLMGAHHPAPQIMPSDRLYSSLAMILNKCKRICQEVGGHMLK